MSFRFPFASQRRRTRGYFAKRELSLSLAEGLVAVRDELSRGSLRRLQGTLESKSLTKRGSEATRRLPVPPSSLRCQFPPALQVCQLNSVGYTGNAASLARTSSIWLGSSSLCGEVSRGKNTDAKLCTWQYCCPCLPLLRMPFGPRRTAGAAFAKGTCCR